MTKASKKLAKRYYDIARGTNKDASNEYYTLFPAFASILLEVLCRHDAGKTYKVIICPCDSQTSVFRELVNYKDLIGNPRIIYSSWPEKDWAEYFDMDFEKEYGCKADEVLILTNPPFKGLSTAIPTIKCDYLLFGSNAVGIIGDTHAKETGVSLYRKNNETYTGDADEFGESFGRVCTFFYSNRPFLSHGDEYVNPRKAKESMMFGKDRLKKVKKDEKKVLTTENESGIITL